MDFFACIFQGFQCLIDFLISIKNQVNKTKKPEAPRKKNLYERHREHLVVYRL